MYRPVSLEVHPEYSLAFVEFDDQGELWAPSQLDRALDHLERLNESEWGVALVLFAHGWNADASPGEEQENGGTVFAFRTILERLHQSIRQEVPEFDIPVMGIYLGWRGRVSSVPLIREASFYNRRGAAERVAGATATEAIYRTLTVMRENPASRSVLIGHSFGSMILERALAQAAVSALLASPDQELIFPADLVVFFNPAGSARHTKQLVDILGRNRLKTYRFDADGNRYEKPLLVSFTSEADTATRRYFPIGMRAKAMNKKFRQYGSEYCSPISNQKRLYTHTAGHLSALHSHEVTVGSKTDRPVEPQPAGRNAPELLRYEETSDPVTQEMAFSFDGERERFTITRKPRALNDTPYWIMRVPRELIPNHTEVMTEDTYRLVEALLVLTAAYDTDVVTTVEREDGVRPVAIVPRLDGTALMVDRSRGVYAVRRDSSRPVFLSCLQEDLDPSDAIGLSVSGPLVQAVLMRRLATGPEERCETELYEFEVDGDGYRRRSQLRLAGSDCYRAAAVDLPGKRILLSLDTEAGPWLRMADLTERPPRPRDLLKLPGNRPATALHFVASREQLFAIQAESGQLWEIALGTQEPRARLVDDSLGWPMALAYSGAAQHLLVADAKERTIWALDCTDECGGPTVFARSDALASPSTLAVALDGTLWLGDLGGQKLVIIGPDGSVENTLHSLSGNTATPTRSERRVPESSGSGEDRR
jgi:hypothetical protein